MAIYKENIIDINLNAGNIYRSFLSQAIGMKDQKADHFGVRVFRDGEPVNLTGVSVQGVFMPPQGSPIAITSGNIVSGNVAAVVLPQACYNYDGQFCLAIKLVDSSNSITGTVRIVDGVVDNTHASGTVAPTSAVPTYQEVLSAYEQAIMVISKSVRYDTDQSLTDAQKTTARGNIEAASEDDVTDLKSAIGSIHGVEYHLDYSNLSNIGYIINSSNKWQSALSSVGTAIVAEIPNGYSDIEFVVGEYGCLIAFLDTYSAPVTGETPDFSATYSGRIIISTSGKVTYTLPTDVHYLYVLLTNSSDEDLRITDVVLHSQIEHDVEDNTKGVENSAEALNHYPDTIEAVTGVRTAVFTPGYYRTPKEGTEVIRIDSAAARAGAMTALIPVTPGEKVTMNCSGGEALGRLYVFIDSNGECVSRSGENLTGKRTVTVPANAVYIAINNKLSMQGSGYYAYVNDSLIDVHAQQKAIFNNEMNAVSVITGMTVGNFISGYWTTPDTGETVEYVENINAVCTKIPVGDNDYGAVYGTGGSGNVRLYVFVDSSGKAIKRAGPNASGLKEGPAPEGAVYLCVNNLLTEQQTGYYAYMYKEGQKKLDAINEKQEMISDAVALDVNGIQYEIGKYINASGEIKTGTALALSQFILVKPGDVFINNVPATDDDNIDLIVAIHKFNKVTWVGYETPDVGGTVTIPDNVDVIRIVFGRSAAAGVALTRSDIATYMKGSIIKKTHGVLEGKRVSIIGTSDSTFAGYVPSENRVYYNGSNFGVTSVGNCWWHIGITENGGLPLINDSWSGSTVAKNVPDRSETTFRPLVELSRCQNLHAYQHGGTSSDTLVTSENISTLRHSPWDDDQTAWTVGEYVKEIDPDVIIINAGGNDYPYNCPMGTYDGHDLLDATALTTFREAYANLINRIQSRYPYALVICCTPIFFIRPELTETNDRNQVNKNSIGLTYKDYQDAIKELATLKGCPVIDGFVHGFNRYNYYDVFCQDSSTYPVHPNALGHLVYGKDFKKKLANCVMGLID